MSGPFGSSQWMYNAGGGFYDYEIDGSLRFNTVDSPRLTRSVTHNRKTFTISFWTKRCNVIRNMLYGTYSSGSDTAVLGFETDGTLSFYDYLSGYRVQVRTNQVFRDNNAWYHIVVAVDTTQATASDRVKMYVNGEQITSFQTATYPSQNLDLKWGAGGTHAIGTEGTNSRLWYDGYLANWALVAGQQLDPTSFGEFKSGIWKPIDITGLTYGTGGYLLEFDGNANDTSGNGNNWTENNFSSYDYLLDSPTNNFPTMTYEALKGAGYMQHREGNLHLYQPSWGGWDLRIATSNMPATGKYYWEAYPAQGNFSAGSGGFIMAFDNIRGNENMSGFPQFGAPMLYFESGNLGEYRVNPGWVNYTKSGSFAYTVNSTVFQVAVDCDNNKIWFGINNSWMGVSGTTVTAGTGNPATGSNGQAISGDVTDYVFAMQVADQTSACRAGVNFGQDSTFAGYKTAGGNSDENGYGDFQYAPPSGFVALCSQNMPEPTFSPLDDVTPEDHFNTAIWTGDSTNGRDIVTGHASDIVWIKSRSHATNHYFFDSYRGPNAQLITHDTAGSVIYSTDRMTAFNTDGFEVGAFTETNGSGRTFVGWSWKAGGSSYATNTDGSITTEVSTNADAGISIIEYTGNSTNGATIGHNLGVTPDHIIIKRYSSAEAWVNWHKGFSGTQYLRLYQNIAVDTATTLFNSTLPNSSVITLGTGGFTNTSGENYMCYAFAEKEGYSKFGTYTGNGSSDGTFIYTGFRPAFVMLKRTDSTSNWSIIDATRNPYNVVTNYLDPNASNAESSNFNWADFTSNGFKLRATNATWNVSGGSYIYMAFAEQPFKYANAR